MMAILLQLLAEMAQQNYDVMIEAENVEKINDMEWDIIKDKSERINKFTVDDVCPDYYWVDFEKDQSDWQGRTEKHDESCY